MLNQRFKSLLKTFKITNINLDDLEVSLIRSIESKPSLSQENLKLTNKTAEFELISKSNNSLNRQVIALNVNFF